MHRRRPAIAGLLGILVLLGAWLWLARTGNEPATPEPGPAPEPARATAPSALEEAAAEPAREPVDATPAALRDWHRRPTLGVSLGERTNPRRMVPLDGEQPGRGKRPPEFTSVVAKSQTAWAKHLGPFLYPPGHPDQGRWRDSVSLEQAVQAQVDYWREMLPPGHLDDPKLHFVGKVSHGALNERLRSWDRESVESSREFYEWLQEQPEDPKAHPFRVWLPADPNDPEVTTRGDDMAERIRQTEAVNFPDDAES